MTSVRTIVAIATIAALSACGTVMTTAKSGHLSGHGALAKAPDAASPQGRPAQTRAAITRVETVSPALNTVSGLLLIVPLDRGRAALAIDAVDLQTGRQLAAP